MKLLILIIVLFLTYANFCYAELNEAEEQVVFYMNYLQEMSYTAEYSEGMSKKDVGEYLNENINYISEIYRMSPDDILSLMIYKNNNKPLPETYKSPTMPIDDQKMVLNDKMKESVERYSKYSESQPGRK
ncbi:MAG: hypothetical protein P9L88_02840 [Candidatus Tantalella remota]|nr:hypothetical protein [Candidatus Tantalella remota]